MSKENDVENRNNHNIEKIDIIVCIKDYINVLLKLWFPIIILIVIFAGLSGYKGYRGFTPVYTASATYAINIQDGSSSNKRFYNNSTAEQMAKTFPHILTSGVLQRKVAADMGLEGIPGSVSASVEPNTNFLTIAVTSMDPEDAHNVLQSVVKNYPSVSELIIGKVDMELLDETGIPTTPDNTRNVVGKVVKGGLAGALLGMLWAFILTFTRRTIRREDQCIKNVNMRCIGKIPFQYKKVRSKNEKRELNLLDKEVSAEFGEVFRIIRNKVEYSAKKNNIKVIIVTSALAGEGKSTIASNLALSLSMDGKKVALLDCDLRHPSIANVLGYEAKTGLIDYLKGDVSLSKCVIKGKEVFEYKLPLIFIPGGSPVADGSKYLCSEKMNLLIEKLKCQTDYIILDTAPAGLMTDAGILAQQADGVICVIKNDYARIEDIIEGMESMTKSDIHVMGCVLNGNV